ncbi:MAG: type II toxin-antitoxin system RelE/ParE family toxin [Flavobacteriales bacterium]|nr:type II toxin-antitoxin system RelE/ParE family toxin [Flavobacteriales bacterium]
MNYSVKVGAMAETDLSKTFYWYEEIREGLGNRFENDFRDAISQLKDNSFRCQIKYDGTRIIFLKIFPYGIHYRIRGNQVQVASVFHTSRKPRFGD